jgi:hypothetical protein
MTVSIPNTTLSTDADLFREEAERARRYAAALIDKTVVKRLHQIAAMYDELATGQDPGPTVATKFELPSMPASGRGSPQWGARIACGHELLIPHFGLVHGLRLSSMTRSWISNRDCGPEV